MTIIWKFFVSFSVPDIFVVENPTFSEMIMYHLVPFIFLVDKPPFFKGDNLVPFIFVVDNWAFFTHFMSYSVLFAPSGHFIYLYSSFFHKRSLILCCLIYLIVLSLSNFTLLHINSFTVWTTRCCEKIQRVRFELIWKVVGR